MVACLMLALLVTTVAAASVGTGSPSGVTTASDEISAVAVAFALIAGILGIMRWRMTGLAPALLAGVAVIVLGVGAVGLGELLARLDVSGVDTAVLGWVRPASVIVSLALLGWAARSPDVNSQLRLPSLLALAFAAVTAVTLLLQLLPSVAVVVAGVLPGSSTDVLGPSLVSLAWLAMAIVYLVKGLRACRLMFAWYGLLLLGLATSEVMRAVGAMTGGPWTAGGSLLRATALLCGVIAGLQELQWVYAHQSVRLLETTNASRDTEARIQEERARQEERAHEARNALAAIEGATVTLERYHHALDAAARGALARAVTGEISRLQRLVGGQDHTAYRIAFRLSDIIEPQVALARSQGAEVVADVPEDLYAYGRPADTAEVLQNLLINARRHAPASPIVVSASYDQGRAVIRVDDRGPGVPPEQRHAIFGRGARASEAPGSGLGLFVAARLMENMGGHLELEDRPGPGACFALRLPGGELAGQHASASAAESLGQVDDHRVPGDVDRMLPPSNLHRSRPGGRRGGQQPDHDVSGHVSGHRR